jgi:hypothetical protein
MDTVSVAASVTGLVSLADVITREGFKFIKDVKEARESVTKLVEEVNNLSGVLHNLYNVVLRLAELQEQGGTFDPVPPINYFASCYKTLSEIRHRFDEDMPDEDVAAMPMSRRLKVLLEESHAERLLLEIERHKKIGSLALTAKEM